jgi:hypothetical protein
MLTMQSHSEKTGIRLYVTYGAPNSIMAVDNHEAKFEPPPPVSLIGNLSEKKKVIDLLGLGEYQLGEILG